MLELFLSILDDPDPDEETLVKREAIMNAFNAFSNSCTSFVHHKEVATYQFTSSGQAKSLGFGRELFEDLLQKAEALGISRVRTIASFLCTWAGWDGSVLKSTVDLIVPNDEEILQFFRDIIQEVFGDIDVRENPAASKFEGILSFFTCDPRMSAPSSSMS